jgi:hypothetical protein
VTTFRGYGPRPRGQYPVVDGILHADLMPEVPAWELSAGYRHHRDPYVGVTEDGSVRPGLYRLDDTGVAPSAAAEAARAYLDTLEPHQLAVGRLAMDSPDWRLWSNAFPTWAPKGMHLRRLGAPAREAALAVVEASLGPDGFATARAAMRLNGALGELVDDYRDTLHEYGYWFTVFGDPASSDPWGWQLMGHHVDLHCVVVDGRVVLAPVFLGAEPVVAESGTYAGVHAFDAETGAGLALRRAMDPTQEDRFLLGTSMLSADLPPELGGPFNGRHLAGAGRDNLVLPPEGIRGSDLREEQRELLLALVRVYAGRLPAGAARAKTDQVARHLDETWFAWRGAHDDVGAFYYRLHSPVMLVEYDNHPGIFLDNDEPERFHVHTIVREPHGNDYGRDLLAQHYARHHGGEARTGPGA